MKVAVSVPLENWPLVSLPQSCGKAPTQEYLSNTDLSSQIFFEKVEWVWKGGWVWKELVKRDAYDQNKQNSQNNYYIYISWVPSEFIIHEEGK